MNKKAKIVATLMAMCLVITLGVFGILAVKTLNMSVGGNITFNAEGVAFTIGNGKFYKDDNTTEYANITTQTGKMLGFAMNTDTTLESVSDEIATWTKLELSLDSQGDAVLKFNIKNDMTNKELYVSFAVTHGTNTNNNMKITAPTSEKIAALSNKDIVIKFDVLDTSINAGLKGFKIDLVFGEPVQVNSSGVVTNQTNTKYTNAKYTLNTTNKTATITKSADAVSGEIVLVDKVYSGSQEYAVTAIADSAFNACSSLTGDLVIPNGVTTIGSSAFYNCTGINGQLVIPSTVTSIGANAFAGCSGLTSIECKAKTPPTIANPSTFTNTGNGSIYVPASRVDVYKSATNWSNYASRIQVSSEPEEPSAPKTINLSVTSPGNLKDNGNNIFYKTDSNGWLDNSDWVFNDGLYTETLTGTSKLQFVKVCGGEIIDEVPSNVEYTNIINSQEFDTDSNYVIGTFLVISVESEANNRYYLLNNGLGDFAWELDLTGFSDDVINISIGWLDE